MQRFYPALRFRPLVPRFRGTFAPFWRASLRPIAIACFRLFTLRPELLLSVPFFLRSMADFTRLPAALPYLAMCILLEHGPCKGCAEADGSVSTQPPTLCRMVPAGLPVAA